MVGCEYAWTESQCGEFVCSKWESEKQVLRSIRSHDSSGCNEYKDGCQPYIAQPTLMPRCYIIMQSPNIFFLFIRVHTYGSET